MISQSTVSGDTKRILVADSDVAMRNVVKNFLGMYFQVDAVGSSDEAGELLRAGNRYDLLLADTHLLPMNGITFLSTTRQLYPSMKLAVMTKSRVEDLFSALIKSDMFNVLVKSIPFGFDEFLTAVENLLYPLKSIGLARYLREPREVHQKVLANKTDKQDAVNAAVAFFRRYRAYDTDVSGIRLAFEELINNAIFHAFRRGSGEKYQVGSFENLSADEEIVVEYGRDSLYVGCSVSDNQGVLDPATILSKMERQISMEGLMDENGRGMHLTRTLCDRMIINVRPGKFSQVILLFAHRPSGSPKPLYTNVITDSRLYVEPTSPLLEK